MLLCISLSLKSQFENYYKFLMPSYFLTTLYYSSKLLKIEDLYKLDMAKFMYLYEHNKLLPLFRDYFSPLKNIHCHNIRGASPNKRFLPFFSSNKAQTIINYTGV